MKLYELTENYNQVMELAEQLDDETLKDTLDSIDEAIEIKIENTAKVVRSLESNVEAIDSELKRLSAKKSTLQNNIKGIKAYMQESMEKVGKTKIKGQLFNVGIQNNPVSVKVTNPELIPKGFLVPQPPKVDKKALKEELQHGDIPGAELIQNKSLRIR